VTAAPPRARHTRLASRTAPRKPPLDARQRRQAAQLPGQGRAGENYAADLVTRTPEPDREGHMDRQICISLHPSPARSQPRVLGDAAGGVTFLLSRAVVYAEQLLTSDIRLSGAGDFIGTRMCRTDSGIIWLAESASPSTEWPAAGLGQGGGGERRSLAVPPGPDLRPGSGHPSVASISFPAYVGDVDHSGEAGVAGDRHVTVVPGRHDLGRVTDAWRGAEGQAVVITASPQTSLTSFLSAIARAMSASVMMPTG
jgi:hypothetical protein